MDRCALRAFLLHKSITALLCGFFFLSSARSPSVGIIFHLFVSFFSVSWVTQHLSWNGWNIRITSSFSHLFINQPRRCQAIIYFFYHSISVNPSSSACLSVFAEAPFLFWSLICRLFPHHCLWGKGEEDGLIEYHWLHSVQSASEPALPESLVMYNGYGPCLSESVALLRFMCTSVRFAPSFSAFVVVSASS